MDLVVNHTSKDCPLIRTHPEWYRWGQDGQVVSPYVRDPTTPRRSPSGATGGHDNDRARPRAQWAFWASGGEAVELGFHGFRCDAAYRCRPAMAPPDRRGEGRRPGVVFFAETLGAPVEDVAGLAGAGFDYFFNSSKWWSFTEPWALDQHEAFRHVAPSISFPESHDTARLAEETGGDEAVQRQRYAFAAAFSAGVMMPVGYEFGFRTQLDVVKTMPGDWAPRTMDLRGFITRVNQLKRDHRAARRGVLRAPRGTMEDTWCWSAARPTRGGGEGVDPAEQGVGGAPRGAAGRDRAARARPGQPPLPRLPRRRAADGRAGARGRLAGPRRGGLRAPGAHRTGATAPPPPLIQE